MEIPGLSGPSCRRKGMEMHKTPLRRHIRRQWSLLVAMLWIAITGSHESLQAQQISTNLTITSPLTGATFAPGQTVTVSVSVSGASQFEAIQVVGGKLG